jgi:hypothetical protein
MFFLPLKNLPNYNLAIGFYSGLAALGRTKLLQPKPYRLFLQQNLKLDKYRHALELSRENNYRVFHVTTRLRAGSLTGHN